MKKRSKWFYFIWTASINENGDLQYRLSKSHEDHIAEDLDTLINDEGETLYSMICLESNNDDEWMLLNL